MYGYIPYIYHETIIKYMDMASTVIKESRFDTRVSRRQKMLFEKAAELGGYRSFSDFVVTILQERAEEIVKERERILASEKDCETFFNAVMNVSKPNNVLKAAADDYKAKYLNKNV